MYAFLTDDFLLHSDTAKELYHNHAAKMPIYDYHCHLSPQEIAEDKKFENMTQIWLYGDHYKWRAMRSNGIPEKYITGNASDPEKFMAWARTVPYTLRNPLYHWTHMELKIPFGISDKVLNQDTAEDIYGLCNNLLKKEEFSARGIISRMNVALICTTDDPTGTLEWHEKISRDNSFKTKVYPAFRPDKALTINLPDVFLPWIKKLGEVSNTSISSVQTLKDALIKRYDDFHAADCRLSDTGLDAMVADDYTDKVVGAAFDKAINNKPLTPAEVCQFQSAMLAFFGEEQGKRGWVQQFHLGTMRNNNTKMLKEAGPDTGFDSIGDYSYAQALSRYLDRLNSKGLLARTILYNIHPKDNEVMATMLGNFQDGSIPGKMQFGSGWWFLDQKDGMIKQMNALSVLGLLSRFVGMLTDSRSFLSYPRHEYFRRILCNLLGEDVENGEIPKDMELLGRMVEDISFNNARDYFGMRLD
jgi:glucuronate isomerase